MKPIDWPGDLAWIVQQLSPLQDGRVVSRFETEQGPTLRRFGRIRRFGPVQSRLEGTVEISEEPWSKLLDLYDGRRIYACEINGARLLLAFVAKPFVETTSGLADGLKTRWVKLSFRAYLRRHAMREN